MIGYSWMKRGKREENTFGWGGVGLYCNDDVTHMLYDKTASGDIAVLPSLWTFVGWHGSNMGHWERLCRLSARHCDRKLPANHTS